MSSLSATPAYQALQAHYDVTKSILMKDQFAADPDRFNKLSLKFEDILFDYSKNRISEETMDLLYNLAEQQDVLGLAKKNVFWRKDQRNRRSCSSSRRFAQPIQYSNYG
mmetsp:Transcript_32897/g.49653  ORF Transcript_32897/g.49653 Transcript_32897/m.49653 type:complete len:109 (-) Transcript_32897:1384-1710(-)